MIAWSSMLVEGLQIHHLPKRMSRELHVSDSSLRLPGTTWAAAQAQPFQNKPSCRAWTRSLLVRGDGGTSTWNFTFVLHASTHAGSKWLCLWETKWEGGSRCLLSFFSIRLTVLRLLDGKWASLPDASEAEEKACWAMADAFGSWSMTATQLNFTSKLFSDKGWQHFVLLTLLRNPEWNVKLFSLKGWTCYGSSVTSVITVYKNL